MVKRIYDVSMQKNKDFCVPAIFQAIMRKYNIELMQHKIAKEINFDPKKLSLLDNAVDFFKKRNLELKVYYYDEAPFNDHEFLIQTAFENDEDLIVGYNKGNSAHQAHHAHLAIALFGRNLIMIDPENLKEISENVYELERKMWNLDSGVYGLVRKL